MVSFARPISTEISTEMSRRLSMFISNFFVLPLAPAMGASFKSSSILPPWPVYPRGGIDRHCSLSCRCYRVISSILIALLPLNTPIFPRNFVFL